MQFSGLISLIQKRKPGSSRKWEQPLGGKRKKTGQETVLLNKCIHSKKSFRVYKFFLPNLKPSLNNLHYLDMKKLLK